LRQAVGLRWEQRPFTGRHRETPTYVCVCVCSQNGIPNRDINGLLWAKTALPPARLALKNNEYGKLTNHVIFGAQLS